MSLYSQALSGLSAITAKWFDWGDGDKAPVNMVYIMDTADNTPADTLPPGRGLAAGSVPVAISTEDFNELKRSSTGATTSVAGATSATLLVAANTSRKAAVISNDSSAVLYVLLGAGTVSSSVYSFALDAKGTVSEVATVADFTGDIHGIWASATGNARVTELT